jgi:hypothetical protein
MKKIMQILLTLAIPLLLAACPQPITLKTVTLTPSLVGGVSQPYSWQNFACNVPLPGQGLPTNGTGSAALSPGQAYSGYENIYFQGAPPFPCEEGTQWTYRGHVQFDLSRFGTITAATLTFDVDASESTTGGPSPTPPNSYATDLGMAAAPDFWNYDNDVTFPSCQFLSQPNCRVDVHNQVNLWTSGQHPNYGFIISGPVDPFGRQIHNNSAQLTWYGQFSLTVVYNPTSNPQAPQ